MPISCFRKIFFSANLGRLGNFGEKLALECDALVSLVSRAFRYIDSNNIVDRDRLASLPNMFS